MVPLISHWSLVLEDWYKAESATRWNQLTGCPALVTQFLARFQTLIFNVQRVDAEAELFVLKIQSVPREINMAMLQPTTTFVLIIKSVATCYDAHTRLYISTRSVKITRLVELAVIMDTCRFVSSFFHSGANLLSLEKM